MARWSIFREIKDALDQEDIEGLVSSGCPADEYDGEAALIESEIAKITDFGKKPPNAIQCERIVIDAWIEQFGPFKAEDLELRRPAFSAVAQKIATCR